MKTNEHDASSELAIGIDIGGTTTKFGIVNHRGEISNPGSIVTDKFPKIEDFVDELYKDLMPAIDKTGGIDLIKGIGVGAPNGNYYTGTIE
ncbi:MAG: ROK family protein, partial [Ginsengibacter sp.]